MDSNRSEDGFGTTVIEASGDEAEDNEESGFGNFILEGAL